MQKLQQHSVARLCFQLTNLFWYFVLVLGSITSVAFLLAYLDKLPETMNINIAVPISAEAIQLADEFNRSSISIDDAIAKTELINLAQEFPSLFLEFTLFIIIGFAIVLTILYHLKNLLDATVNEAVFIPQNIKRIKIIAVLLFSIDPLRWIFATFISQPLFGNASIDISLSIFSLGYWFIGLLIYTLAAVFEKGHKMYQELKLTV